MNNEDRIKRLKEKDYQELFGIRKNTFEKMLKILEKAYIELHKRRGAKPKLKVLDKLIIMLSYYREYLSMKNMAFDYNVAKSTICESIKWVENVLIKEGSFSLPSKRKLVEELPNIEAVLVDVTEVPIERPKKKSE